LAAVVVYRFDRGPASRILSRRGFAPGAALLALIPLFNLIGLWLLAYTQ
jgi:hypothetical protein